MRTSRLRGRVMKTATEASLLHCANYRPLAIHKWAQEESNLQPTSYEPGALPLSYGPPFVSAVSVPLTAPSVKRTEALAIDRSEREGYTHLID